MTPKSRSDVLPVLVGSKSEGETEGLAPLQDGDCTHLRYVRRFDPKKDKLRDGQKVKQFTAIAKLLALSAGQKVDFSLVQEGFRALVADAYPAAQADLISAKQRDGWALATSGNPSNGASGGCRDSSTGQLRQRNWLCGLQTAGRSVPLYSARIPRRLYMSVCCSHGCFPVTVPAWAVEHSSLRLEPIRSITILSAGTVTVTSDFARGKRNRGNPNLQKRRN